MSDLLDLPAVTKGNSGHSGYERQEHEWYTEDRQAVLDLLDRETFDGSVHDPACGGGNIPTCCVERGIPASGSDIIDRGYGAVGDFLKSSAPLDSVITNPPFKIATPFTLHALRLAHGKVCILQQLTWLEGQRRGRELFDLGMLARVWVFRRRISLPPGDKAIEATGGKKAFAWFVFDKKHRGPWSGGWIE